MLRLALSFGSAFVVAAAVTPLVRAAARRFGFVARPTADRWHREPTALLGGIAIYVACFAGVAAALWVPNGHAPQLAEVVGSPGFGLLIAATILFVGGLADDRYKLRPNSKLIIQLIAGATVVSFGIVYPITPWATVNILATLLWFLAITNAFNLLDNMDGVAAGVAAVAAAFLAWQFAVDGQWILAGVCAALLGATLGFLPYNFHPATIFMGDSGSLVIGGVLAGLGAAFPSTASGNLIPALFVPVFIVIIPILDTALVTVARTSVGRPISMGGRDHTSHRLVAMGLSERQVALLLYAFAALGAGLAMAMRGTGLGWNLWIGGLFLVALGVTAAYLGHMHVYAASDRPNGGKRRTLLISTLLYKRRALEVVLDMILFAAAYYGAYLLRWDGAPPPSQVDVLQRTMAVAVVSKSAAFGLLGIYRGIWHQTTFTDLHRLLRGVLLGTLLTVVIVVFGFREAEFSRSVFVLDALLVALFVFTTRSSFRSLDLLKRHLNRPGERAIVYGAGKGGELVVRELLANPEWGLEPVAFIDDDPLKHGFLIHGLPVLGGVASLPSILRQQKVGVIVTGTKKLTPDHLERMMEAARETGGKALHMELTFRAVEPARMIAVQ